MSGQRGTTGELEIPEADRRGPHAQDLTSGTRRTDTPTVGASWSTTSSPDQRRVGGIERTEDTDTNALAIGAIVLGVLAVFFLPIVLGPIGIVLAVMARNRGQSLGNVALWVAIGGTVVGLAFGVLALTMTEGEVVDGALQALAA